MTGGTPEAGFELPRRVFGPITMTDIVSYQGASGDLNPMHHDDALARSVGYPAAFSVGMLGAGYLATMCTDHFGTEGVRRFRTRFRQVVFRGTTVTAHGRVVDVHIDGETTLVTVALALTTDAGVLAIDGEAQFAL